MFWVICGPIVSCNSTKAETLGLLMGLRELKKLGAHGSTAEGDSFTTIEWGKGIGEGSWKLEHFVNEIQDISCLLGFKLYHVLRVQSSLADKLANWGSGRSSLFIDSELPDGIT